MDGAALYGLALYGVSLLTMGGIYAILCLGLNLQWGMAGILNVGVAGFFAIGAYTSAILTTPESPYHLGGYGLPIVLAVPAAMLAAALLAWAVGRICVRLRSDYLAIATIGISEIVRLVLGVEVWATNGPRGVAHVPRPLSWLPEPLDQIGFLLIVLACLAVVYLLLEQAANSPWGRTMAAIRDNEGTARSIGKDVDRRRLQAMVLGAAFMGLGGALTAHYLRFIDPKAAEPLTTTFLVWVMLIAGGSGNNRGALLGAFLLWLIWSGTEIVAGLLPSDLSVRVAYIRVFLVGFFLQIILQRYPGGILPERRGRRIGKLGEADGTAAKTPAPPV